MHEEYIKEAIEEAEEAYNMGEVPVGAVIVQSGKIIAKAHNLKETLKDATAHAEILAIRQASEVVNNWRLQDCEMYVTLEPCPMCAAAIAAARIRSLYIGTFDPSLGACGSVINILQNDYLKYNINIKWLYSNQCSDIIINFFKLKRKSND